MKNCFLKRPNELKYEYYSKPIRKMDINKVHEVLLD